VQARTVFDALDFSGPTTILSNACASGGNAIGHAFDLIRSGQAERVVAGGYDALGELVFSGFDSLQALSPTICRPFDAHRDGLALGEGAAILNLETLAHAQRRGAEILGELIGYATAIDQHHLTQPHPQGNTTLQVMKQACANARVTPDEIDYINAHGTGTVLNDASEALAISEWAGTRAETLPVSSTKASIGHLLGGAGAVEAVVCLMTLREQWLPPEMEFETPDPACRFPIVHQMQDARVNLVLSNSFGFGGVNASLIFRRWA
jgi:3-oxoacyl-[acyl-carrier-protein] synthase II